ncbi:MAG TPA: cytochrome C biogenesis protein, partial [Pseudobdellovibrionaceae bacterium]|nr:cytochrome C biogenesis protein [Pseudobdellovibrionaceae bacterium]
MANNLFKQLMRTILSIFNLLTLCLVFETSNATDLRELPVQDGGRIKSFDSFARESLELIYGKQKFEGRPAHEIVLTWALLPEAWKDKKIFEVKNHEIISRLSLDGRERYFTGDDLLKNGELARLVGDLEERRKNKEKLTPFYQDIQRIESQ